MQKEGLTAMNSYERIKRTFERKETDRIPIYDVPWAGTLRRWRKEGMPEDADWRDYLGADRVETIDISISPRYEFKILEQNERYRIVTTPWGVTMKQFNEEDSTPEFLDFKVNTPEAWEEAKSRMTVSRDRINWEKLEKCYPEWRKNGSWIQAGFWFGFDVTHSWMAGTETVLCAMLEEPEWVEDMFKTYLDMCIAHFEMIWDAGYRFDAIRWPDDMGYKGTAFFSNDTYKSLLQPYHKKAVAWAHERGIYACLHSCGDIMKLLPDIADTGIDSLNPIEVKAGMDREKLKKEYGDKLVLHGGVNAALWSDKEKMLAETETALGILAKDGGYIFSSDHSIPNNASLDTVRAVFDKVRSYGK